VFWNTDVNLIFSKEWFSRFVYMPPRMNGDRFDIRIALHKLLGEEHVGEFRVSVARVGVVGLLLRRCFVWEESRTLGCEAFARGGEVDDPHVRAGFGGPSLVAAAA
jgi:hypothetical protein